MNDGIVQQKRCNKFKSINLDSNTTSTTTAFTSWLTFHKKNTQIGRIDITREIFLYATKPNKI